MNGVSAQRDAKQSAIVAVQLEVGSPLTAGAIRVNFAHDSGEVLRKHYALAEELAEPRTGRRYATRAWIQPVMSLMNDIWHS